MFMVVQSFLYLILVKYLHFDILCSSLVVLYYAGKKYSIDHLIPLIPLITIYSA